ncbi:GlsB/YeaQ/YmgE family stress response membrane protein [Dietzia maris]|jgi:uncharacterized membrane protein YeaQ/YmgE (transglycosylase-associated protein family)|nr:GlsB/YeaQ/YmgE family stress response membrane protein [Dietzia maris]MDN4507462.1 GlsB/YeaQ/YmgE family stress response membrane protein [Dietzia maris]
MIMGKNAQMGLVANVLAGVIGAFIVGLLVSLVTGGGGMPEAFSIWGFVAAIIGAILVIFIVSAVKGRGRTRV